MIKYLAGIFDSEGYVRIRKTNHKFYTPEVKLYMCDEKVVKKFASLYKLKVKSCKRGVNLKTVYYVSIGVKQLRTNSFIDDFLPFLNEKRLQLQEVKNLLAGSKDKEQCYQDYMKAKENFEHPINGELSYEYLAGIIDGDGYFSFFNAGKAKKSILNHFRVGIQQRYRPMIEYMTRFGGSDVHRCKVYDYISHVQTYSWQCSTSEVLPLLYGIQPYLIEKKVRCSKLIKYIEDYEKFKTKSDELLKWWKEQD